jgi:hypothetical protein
MFAKLLGRAGVVVLAGGVTVAALLAASPAVAATTATVTLGGPLAAGQQTALTVDVAPDAGAAVSLVSATVTPDAGSTGSIAIAPAVAAGSLDACAAVADGVQCAWVGAGQDASGSLTTQLTASPDASGTFTLAIGQVVDGVSTTIHSQTITIAPAIAAPAALPAAPAPAAANTVTATLAAPSTGTAGVPVTGITLSLTAPADDSAPGLPTQAGIRFTETSGNATMAFVRTEGTGLSNCVGADDSVVCDWAATPNATATLSPTLLVDAPSTWSAVPFWTTGDAVRVDLPETGTITIVGASGAGAGGGSALADTGSDPIGPLSAAVVILSLGAGAVLVAASRRRRNARAVQADER